MDPFEVEKFDMQQISIPGDPRCEWNEHCFHMLAHRYMEENTMAVMLAAKRLAGVTPGVNFRDV